MNETTEGSDSRLYSMSANVSFEDIANYLDELWADLHRKGSPTYARAIASGIETAALPTNIEEYIDFKKSAAGLDHSVVDFVVMLAGTEAAKVVGRGVIKVSSQLWDLVLLPLIRRKWGDEALKEKAHETGEKK
jgi:predicted NAD-dependent protein-ADP-ribosyltransferase YbiA (DUF1768 family)